MTWCVKDSHGNLYGEGWVFRCYVDAYARALSMAFNETFTVEEE